MPIVVASTGFILLHGWIVVPGKPYHVVLSLIPILLLLNSGYVVAEMTGNRRASGFGRGASVAVGYLAMTVFTIGYGFLKFSTMDTRVVTPDVELIVVGVLITGVAFPVVLGGIGGKLAG